MVTARSQAVLSLFGLDQNCANDRRKAHISVKRPVFSEVIFPCDGQWQVILDEEVRRLGRPSSALKAQENFLHEK